jgi:hypothetical protein
MWSAPGQNHASGASELDRSELGGDVEVGRREEWKGQQGLNELKSIDLREKQKT